jgi:hypothetical protein
MIAKTKTPPHTDKLLLKNFRPKVCLETEENRGFDYAKAAQ